MVSFIYWVTITFFLRSGFTGLLLAAIPLFEVKRHRLIQQSAIVHRIFINCLEKSFLPKAFSSRLLQQTCFKRTSCAGRTMNSLWFYSVVIICLMVRSVHCQEDEEGLFSKFKKLVKNFIDSMRDIWEDFKQEVKARSTDMKDWTQEMFESFKQKMKEWVEQSSSASDKEKEDMKRYLERLEMTEES